MATAIHPLGLLSLVLTDAQWAAYPGNTTIANGAPQISPRYQPLAHVEFLAAMTSQELPPRICVWAPDYQYHPDELRAGVP